MLSAIEYDEPQRPIFSEEHEMFREQVRKFLAKEVIPHHEKWEEDGQISREAWVQAGKAGLLCPTVNEEYGGLGLDFLFSVVIMEELARAGTSGPGFWVHSEMVTPYISKFGSEEQKQYWLPKMISGEAIGAVAMTEPAAGSDLRGIKTTARRDGDDWILNGQKVFISNGQMADVLILAAKTAGDRISLFIVDTALPGFRRGKRLSKLGAHAQDTSELFLDQMRLPANALLGEVGAGFSYLLKGLARERLAISATCQCKAEYAFVHTVDYVKSRDLFGQNLLDFQNTRFVLANVKTDLVVGRALIDDLLAKFQRQELDETAPAIAKLWTTEMLGRTVDACLQLHGGWGYMTEYPICKAYADARVERIAGGTSEVMREIIGRTI